MKEPGYEARCTVIGGLRVSTVYTWPLHFRAY